MKNCLIHTLNLQSSKRKSLEDSVCFKDKSGIYITFCKEDSLENLIFQIASLNGKTNRFFSILFKKTLSKFIAVIGVLFILLAFLAVSIYEDFFKKLLFETDLNLGGDEIISIVFVAILFFGLLLLPQAFDAEGNGLKSLIASWLNTDTRRAKKLRLTLLNFSPKTQIHLYNFDLKSGDEWLWSIFTKEILRRFENVNFYIRSDKIADISDTLTKLGVRKIEISQNQDSLNSNEEFDFKFMLSDQERKFYDLMRLCSTFIIKKSNQNTYISLELFEYCGRNFFEENSRQNSSKLIFGFQNFITRSFKDFGFLTQQRSLQIFFAQKVKYDNLQAEERELAQYLRNHIEHCVQIFDNPLSLLILYHYTKNLVLDERRSVKILEKFIKKVKEKQHYELINFYWFDIAGKMFELHDIKAFESSQNSVYRKLSISALDDLIFLFKRNGHFSEAILLNRYLYEINPAKYALNISSLYERAGNLKAAYENFPKRLNSGSKPSDIELRYYQRKAAWIIISQRDESRKHEAIDILSKLEEMLFNHNEDNEPLWLWHFYNIKANLCEWQGNFKEAIEFYKKCLFVPALGAFEYGASFVNMAISYRLEFIAKNLSDQSDIDTAIRLGRIGLNLKQSIGDRDELAIALHNLALNILYKISTSANENLCKEVLNLSRRALEILDETNSIKRLGIVLVENFIATVLLRHDVAHIKERLKAQYQNISQDELAQMKRIYFKFRQNQAIDRLEILES